MVPLSFRIQASLRHLALCFQSILCHTHLVQRSRCGGHTLLLAAVKPHPCHRKGGTKGLWSTLRRTSGHPDMTAVAGPDDTGGLWRLVHSCGGGLGMDLQNHRQTTTPWKGKKQTFTEAVFFCFVFNLSKALHCLPAAPFCSGQLQAMPPFGSQAVSLGLANKWERAGVQRLPPFTDQFGGKLGWRGLPVQSPWVRGTARSPLTAELQGLLAFSGEGLVSSAG